MNRSAESTNPLLFGEQLDNFLQEFTGEDSSLTGSFTKANSLIRRNSATSHKLCQLTKKQHNVECIFIVVNKQASFSTKKDVITQCLVADETAAIFMNFYNETGQMIQEGDIIYASGIYASHFKDMLLLYQGSQSIIRRIDRCFMRFNTARNMSQQSLENPTKSSQQK